jgi:hypothetical protein
MANLTSCKIKVESIEGEIDFKTLYENMEKLQAENNILGIIHVFVSTNKRWAQVRFAVKWYPAIISELVEATDYEIWVLGSDEGGGSDFIRYYPSSISEIDEFTEKALYKLDKIKLVGDSDLITRNLRKLLGWGTEYLRPKKIDQGIEIELSGIYKANNYFTNESDKSILITPVDKYSFEEVSTRSELWDSIWSIDGIEFRNNFYQEVVKQPDGINKFPYLTKIEFEYKDITTNIFERKTDTESNWEHKSIDSFHNCVNNNFILYSYAKEKWGR